MTNPKFTSRFNFMFKSNFKPKPNSIFNSIFNIQLQHPTSTSNFNIQLQHPTSTSNFNIQLQHPTSTSNFNIQLQHPTSTSNFNIQPQLQLPIQSINLNQPHIHSTSPPKNSNHTTHITSHHNLQTHSIKSIQFNSIHSCHSFASATRKTRSKTTTTEKHACNVQYFHMDIALPHSSLSTMHRVHPIPKSSLLPLTYHDMINKQRNPHIHSCMQKTQSLVTNDPVCIR